MAPAIELDTLADQLQGADIEVIEKIAPQGILAVPGGTAPVPPILVARMTHERAQALAGASGGRLLITRNEPLTLAEAMPSGARSVFPDPAVARPLGRATAITIEVRCNGKTLPRARVYLFGQNATTDGLTDANGQARLLLYDDTIDTISAAAVLPAADAWSRYIPRPSLDAGAVNLIELRPLTETLPDFPASGHLGWGCRAMRLDQLPATSRGRGVRIAIIDSGADVTHRNLRHVKQGVDVPRDDGDGWKQDPIGHGTHCAGIIAAGHADGFGIRGIAPEAELHILKVMPEGHVDDLIKALQYCMQNDIDIVCCGIGAVGAPNSAIAALLEPFFIKAREMGIACIVPAGNTATPVQYPACSPNVLTVAAVGRFGEFPGDSYHATVAVPPASPEGFFLTRFSCWGPEIGLSGPGVAVVSTVPENGFAAYDGTSMAAAHVAGLAALVVAHNLDFQIAFAGRNAARVDHLLNVLVHSAQPIAGGDRIRVGAGLPNAVAALQPWAGGQPSITLTPDQQAEVARRVAEAVQNALSPAVARSIASMMGASAPSHQPPGDLGLAAVWPFPPRG